MDAGKEFPTYMYVMLIKEEHVFLSLLHTSTSKAQKKESSSWFTCEGFSLCFLVRPVSGV